MSFQSDVPKPFRCSTTGCSSTFTNVDHLTVHQKRHNSPVLPALFPISRSSSLSLAADLTPTPTRLIRIGDDVGLFQELQRANPFDEQFRRAAAWNSSNLVSPITPGSSNAGDEPLNTPTVFDIPDQLAVVKCAPTHPILTDDTRQGSDDGATPPLVVITPSSPGGAEFSETGRADISAIGGATDNTSNCCTTDSNSVKSEIPSPLDMRYSVLPVDSPLGNSAVSVTVQSSTVSSTVSTSCRPRSCSYPTTSSSSSLPSPAASLPSPAASLPSPAASLPSPAASLPSSAATLSSPAAPLPSPAAPLPSPVVSLPSLSCLKPVASSVPPSTGVIIQGRLLPSSPNDIKMSPELHTTSALQGTKRALSPGYDVLNKTRHLSTSDVASGDDVKLTGDVMSSGLVRADMDRKARNRAASLRWRAKKRRVENELEKSVQMWKDRVSELQLENRQLRAELVEYQEYVQLHQRHCTINDACPDFKVEVNDSTDSPAPQQRRPSQRQSAHLLRGREKPCATQDRATLPLSVEQGGWVPAPISVQQSEWAPAPARAPVPPLRKQDKVAIPPVRRQVRVGLPTLLQRERAGLQPSLQDGRAGFSPLVQQGRVGLPPPALMSAAGIQTVQLPSDLSAPILLLPAAGSACKAGGPALVMLNRQQQHQLMTGRQTNTRADDTPPL